MLRCRALDRADLATGLRQALLQGLRLFKGFVDGTDHVEGLFGKFVAFAFNNHLEAADRFLERNVLAGSTGKHFSNVERLGEIVLDLASSHNRQLVFRSEFVHTENGDDVAEFLVALERFLNTTADGVVLFADDVRVDLAGRGVKRVNGRCGTGSMTWLLAGRGYELIAVDGSQEMLAAAREKSAPAEVPPLFLHQSMPRLDLYGTVDAAICCLDSLNYLTNPRDVQRTFQRLHLFISPGGLLAFDVRLPERLAALDGQVFLDETEDTYCVWRTEYRRGLCTYYMDLFTLAEDGSWDRSFELHRQRGYSVEQLTRWLEEAGFADVRTWGDGKLRRPVPGEDRVYFTCIRK